MATNKKTILHGGEYLVLHENGQIERPGLVRPSDSWRVTGAVTRNNFGRVTRRYSLDEILTLTNIPWVFKNGSQKTFIQDFDHGTFREWRSPNHKIF